MMTWAFAIAMIGFAVFGLREIRRIRRRIARLRQEKPVPGIVVDYERLPNSDGSFTRYPVVQFNAPTGEPVTARSDFGGDLVPAIGRRVVVLRDPDQPDQVHIESRLYDRLHLGFAVLCWLILVAGVALAVMQLDGLTGRIVGATPGWPYGIDGWRVPAILLVGLLITVTGMTAGVLLISYARRIRRDSERLWQDGHGASGVVVDDQTYLQSGFRASRRNTFVAAMGWIMILGFPLVAITVLLIAVNWLL
jgi:Protein of unknown function (DUF3592)